MDRLEDTRAGSYFAQRINVPIQGGNAAGRLGHPILFTQLSNFCSIQPLVVVNDLFYCKQSSLTKLTNCTIFKILCSWLARIAY